jgi:hypothetical protein
LNDLVSIFNINANIFADLFGEFSILIDWNWSVAWVDKTAFDAALIILLTKAWSTVDNTGTGV